MSEHNESAHTFDVVIAGGGLSGALMAQSIASLTQANGQKLSIAVIEATAVNENISLTFDDRVLALAHGTAAYLDELSVWSSLTPDATPITDIHISDRGYYGKARINAQEHHVDALGYVIEMSLIGKSLIQTLKQHSNVTWFCPDKIANITWQQSHVELTLESNTQLTASLLIACDGGQSYCRNQANIQNTFHDYHQSAIIANVRTAKVHNNVAFERFTQNGPIAMLPLSNGRSSLVWSLEPEEAEQIQKLSDDDFAKALEQSFGQWLGEFTEVGQRACYPLVLVQAQEQVYHRMALVGNASHTIHPIAGQGFNLGVRDVKALATIIASALAKGENIGAFNFLNDYANVRKVDQNQVINLTDSLVSLFSNQYCPLIAGRNIGLKLMNYVSPLQEAFIDKTMGYR